MGSSATNNDGDVVGQFDPFGVAAQQQNEDSESADNNSQHNKFHISLSGMLMLDRPSLSADRGEEDEKSAASKRSKQSAAASITKTLEVSEMEEAQSIFSQAFDDDDDINNNAAITEAHGTFDDDLLHDSLTSEGDDDLDSLMEPEEEAEDEAADIKSVATEKKKKPAMRLEEYTSSLKKQDQLEDEEKSDNSHPKRSVSSEASPTSVMDTSQQPPEPAFGAPSAPADGGFFQQISSSNNEGSMRGRPRSLSMSRPENQPTNNKVEGSGRASRSLSMVVPEKRGVSRTRSSSSFDSLGGKSGGGSTGSTGRSETAAALAEQLRASIHRRTTMRQFQKSAARSRSPSVSGRSKNRSNMVEMEDAVVLSSASQRSSSDLRKNEETGNGAADEVDIEAMIERHAIRARQQRAGKDAAAAATEKGQTDDMPKVSEVEAMNERHKRISRSTSHDSSDGSDSDDSAPTATTPMKFRQTSEDFNAVRHQKDRTRGRSPHSRSRSKTPDNDNVDIEAMNERHADRARQAAQISAFDSKGRAQPQQRGSIPSNSEIEAMNARHANRAQQQREAAEKLGRPRASSRDSDDHNGGGSTRRRSRSDRRKRSVAEVPDVTRVKVVNQSDNTPIDRKLAQKIVLGLLEKKTKERLVKLAGPKVVAQGSTSSVTGTSPPSSPKVDRRRKIKKKLPSLGDLSLSETRRSKKGGSVGSRSAATKSPGRNRDEKGSVVGDPQTPKPDKNAFLKDYLHALNTGDNAQETQQNQLITPVVKRRMKSRYGVSMTEDDLMGMDLASILRASARAHEAHNDIENTSDKQFVHEICRKVLELNKALQKPAASSGRSKSKSKSGGSDSKPKYAFGESVSSEADWSSSSHLASSSNLLSMSSGDLGASSRTKRKTSKKSALSKSLGSESDKRHGSNSQRKSSRSCSPNKSAKNQDFGGSASSEGEWSMASGANDAAQKSKRKSYSKSSSRRKTSSDAEWPNTTNEGSSRRERSSMKREGSSRRERTSSSSRKGASLSPSKAASRKLRSSHHSPRSSPKTLELTTKSADKMPVFEC